MADGTRTCAAIDCDATIPNGRKYCSRRCNGREHLGCKIDGCQAEHRAHGYCGKHQRLRPGFVRTDKQYVKTCEACGKTYTTPSKDGRVCSMTCRWWIDPRYPKSCPVPQPRIPVDLQHPDRGLWQPVTWANCCWCDQPMVLLPSVRQYAGQAHCSIRCSRRDYKQRRKARERGAPGRYTWAEIIRLFLSGDRRCAYCDEIIEGQPDPDHVIPLSRGGSNSITNIVPACRACNTDKSDHSLAEWEVSRVRRGLAPRRYALTGERFKHLALGPIRDRAWGTAA